ncbi:MAG: hypothetical protein SV760_04635 [Halobacteria archaeon]|nr:hypothetical protein [Halobacteria archaeon]
MFVPFHPSLSDISTEATPDVSDDGEQKTRNGRRNREYIEVNVDEMVEDEYDELHNDVIVER